MGFKKPGAHLKDGQIIGKKADPRNANVWTCGTCGTDNPRNHNSVLKVVEDQWGNRHCKHTPCPAR